MKILLVSGDNPYLDKIGGKHIHLLLLENGLKELGNEVDYLYPGISKFSKLNRYTRYFMNGIKNFKFQNFFPLEILQIKYVINEIEKRFSRFDLSTYSIIHFHDVGALYAFLKTRERPEIPYLLTLHGYFAREAVDYSKIKNRKLKKLFFDYCSKIELETINQSEYIHTVDTRIKDYIVEKYHHPENLIFILHNSVDTKRFAPVSEENKLSLRQKLSYDPNELIIFVPRRLVNKNGVEYAISAIKTLDIMEIKLLIAGSGPLENQLKKLADGDDRIIFLGSIPHEEVDQLYKISDVVLIPSITSHDIQEATSLAMLEGMACGKVVICSNIGGMAEVIKNNETGFVVPEKSAEAISLLILKYFEGKMDVKLISENARNYVVENHSYLSHSHQILELYNKIISKRTQ